MDMSAGQSTLRQPLPMGWVRKLFAELQGNYGTRFLDMWRSGAVVEDGPQKGEDVGVLNAMGLWAEKLAGFRDQPGAIRRALDNLPKHPPTLPEFVELCRGNCPQPQHRALPAPDLTPEQIAERRDGAEKMAEKVASKQYDHRAWAKELRKRFISGERLTFQQIEMASASLREIWAGEGKSRSCVPRYQAEAA